MQAIARNCAIVLRNMATRSSVEAAEGVIHTWTRIVDLGMDKPMVELLGEEAMPAVSRAGNLDNSRGSPGKISLQV